ncbi:multidrug and toxin extrusion protein 2 [Histoplasma capsulatum var. duboisii H88]|uniref:Multidrug and toxin extrusion protein n=2 Tax=Ajellomyces capsulatus TaxID=5037 RepID=F0UNZ0_AJEC8|nr:multidrug and toxin extrusion protein 2/organic cation antiporter [Histoplasma capsulatum H143]EGC47694.1 multidrug and toxin extrusion protein 2 [Histoplasma capsulatum var. duboisii H88]QSS53856.1 multidrug and toxin extrusion protein [Histoplasma capsulatum var. duboisii H88]
MDIPPNSSDANPSRIDGDDDRVDGDLSATSLGNSHSLAESYRRPSFFTTGARGTVVPYPQAQEHAVLADWEREQVLEEERDLLADSHVIHPEHRHAKPAKGQSQITGLLSKKLKESETFSRQEDEESAQLPGSSFGPDSSATETTALLASSTALGNHVSDHVSDDEVGSKWEEAVEAGLIHTTWRREAKVLSKYTVPLMITFILQYSLTVASIFTVGHLGKVELGAVSLASMTANITGYSIYQGLSTSLDTLCAQAYGSGKKSLVGLHMQRMVYFLWLMTIPIGLVWFFAERILMVIVPEKDVAVLAGLYLKVVLLGAPGYACFESGKRFVQAQGLFSAGLAVLVICAPLNAFLNWLFVWKLGFGFVGAPMAVAISDNLLPIFLFLYVRFIAGKECWNGFTKRGLENWGPMIRLALPGFLMVEAEVLAFEILTLAASYFGTTALAAQSVLSTISGISFQIPFPLSIAISTRIANLIGASLSDSARTSAKVGMVGAVIIGLLNVTFLSSLRNYIPNLFTSDEEVARLVAQILPVCASFQLVDALAANCNGILRGLGLQSFGGYVQLFCYYVVAMPISMGTSFGLGWSLWGLWTGVAVALCLVSIIEGVFLTRTDWEISVSDARRRNAMG